MRFNPSDTVKIYGLPNSPVCSVLYGLDQFVSELGEKTEVYVLMYVDKNGLIQSTEGIPSHNLVKYNHSCGM